MIHIYFVVELPAWEAVPVVVKEVLGQVPQVIVMVHVHLHYLTCGYMHTDDTSWFCCNLVIHHVTNHKHKHRGAVSEAAITVCAVSAVLHGYMARETSAGNKSLPAQ